MEMQFGNEDDALSEALTISKALNMLEKGQVIYVISRNGKTFFQLRNGKIIAKSETAGYSLTVSEFTSLYEKSEFYIYTEDEKTYDPLKDKEYYGWKEKTGIGL